MTDVQTSQRLLADYAQNGSEGAFRQLVSHYVNFVYSTALRLVAGDTHFAEDICQIVFSDLARKARTLPAEVKLAGWLHRHTCFVAAKALRRERRRKARERRAVELQSIEDYTTENVSYLGAILDEALNKLRDADRSALMLRFFEERDFRAIAEELGSSEDAARMRVSRALQKLSGVLRRRGVIIAVSGLGFALEAKLCSAAPIGVATRISANALAGVSKSSGLVALVKECCWTKLNIGILSAAAAIALLTILVSVNRGAASRESPAQLATLPVTEPEKENLTPEEEGEVAATPSPPAVATVEFSAIQPATPTVPTLPAPVRAIEKPATQPKPASEPQTTVPAPNIASRSLPPVPGNLPAPEARPVASVVWPQPQFRGIRPAVPQVQPSDAGQRTNAQVKAQSPPAPQPVSRWVQAKQARDLELSLLGSVSAEEITNSASYERVGRGYFRIQSPRGPQTLLQVTPLKENNRTRTQ